MSSKKGEEIEEQLRDWFKTAKPEDLLIMSMGFFAGTQGYTPMTMLLKGFGGDKLSEQVDRMHNAKLKAVTQSVDQLRGINSFLPMGAISNWLFGYAEEQAVSLDQQLYSNTPLTADQLKEQTEAYKATLALGCVGAIESFMITRPGALASVINLAQTGISQIAGIAGPVAKAGIK